MFVKSCAMKALNALDKLDRAILRRLQENGRETYDVIGEQVGLSPSAVLRRVKRLEDSGVIAPLRGPGAARGRGPGTHGLPQRAPGKAHRKPQAQPHGPVPRQRADLARSGRMCASLTGEMDYLLRVVVADMAHYSRFIMDTLLKHPSVQDCKTSFVLDRVKATTAVPV